MGLPDLPTMTEDTKETVIQFLTVVAVIGFAGILVAPTRTGKAVMASGGGVGFFGLISVNGNDAFSGFLALVCAINFVWAVLFATDEDFEDEE